MLNFFYHVSTKVSEHMFDPVVFYNSGALLTDTCFGDVGGALQTIFRGNKSLGYLICTVQGWCRALHLVIVSFCLSFFICCIISTKKC